MRLGFHAARFFFRRHGAGRHRRRRIASSERHRGSMHLLRVRERILRLIVYDYAQYRVAFNTILSRCLPSRPASPRPPRSGEGTIGNAVPTSHPQVLHAHLDFAAGARAPFFLGLKRGTVC